jgi:hypothetical protein
MPYAGSLDQEGCVESGVVIARGNSR